MVLNADKQRIKREFEVYIKQELLKTWTAQGHNMNGKVVKEMDLVVEETANSVSFLFYFFPYGSFIESGVESSKVPYSGRSGSGGKSLYIEALAQYAMRRMNAPSDKEALSIAFAIAETQRREGMPTRASSRFSSDGMRTGWISETMKNSRSTIRSFMLKYMEGIITVKFDNLILKFQKEFKSTA